MPTVYTDAIGRTEVHFMPPAISTFGSWQMADLKFLTVNTMPVVQTDVHILKVSLL